MAAAACTREAQTVRPAAERYDGAVGERHRLRHCAQVQAHPVDVRVEESAGLRKIALHRHRDDDRAPRPTDAQRHPPRRWMPPHLDRSVQTIDPQCLGTGRQNRPGPSH
jgi:hypothetical protein